ncbi:hypothetical protein E2C01_092022 [Portunus trituberculatus]|uniref:Uncharacterized protein n=1 Tax=Portunus trituberculatus TaxID=210409 RepID=A0A5B7JQX8_PORTR|nr:hypothetical protein [Portunus trituberculatus]
MEISCRLFLPSACKYARSRVWRYRLQSQPQGSVMVRRSTECRVPQSSVRCAACPRVLWLLYYIWSM